MIFRVFFFRFFESIFICNFLCISQNKKALIVCLKFERPRNTYTHAHTLAHTCTKWAAAVGEEIHTKTRTSFLSTTLMIVIALMCLYCVNYAFSRRFIYQSCSNFSYFRIVLYCLSFELCARVNCITSLCLTFACDYFKYKEEIS